jgi:hypothetical protein
MVAGVTVDIRLLRFAMERGFIFNFVAFVNDNLVSTIGLLLPFATHSKMGTLI